MIGELIAELIEHCVRAALGLIGKRLDRAYPADKTSFVRLRTGWRLCSFIVTASLLGLVFAYVPFLAASNALTTIIFLFVAGLCWFAVFAVARHAYHARVEWNENGIRISSPLVGTITKRFEEIVEARYFAMTEAWSIAFSCGAAVKFSGLMRGADELLETIEARGKARIVHGW